MPGNTGTPQHMHHPSSLPASRRTSILTVIHGGVLLLAPKEAREDPAFGSREVAGILRALLGGLGGQSTCFGRAARVESNGSQRMSWATYRCGHDTHRAPDVAYLMSVSFILARFHLAVEGWP